LLGCSSNGATTPPPESNGTDDGAHTGHELPDWSLAELAEGAVTIPDLGDWRRPVTTTSREAQAFFDQGLALTYGFNHDEAARSFAKAGALDPDCAMCWWGAAYALGPNYNFPMLPERAAAAWDALTRASAAAPTASPVERALIDALARRYPGPEYVAPEVMQAFNVAYADAMQEVAEQFPDDLDVQVLFAEAMMDVNPWQLWTPEGQPAPGTETIVATLEAVLAKAPNHPGANHYYIHAVEASPEPGRAEAAADRLPSLIPGAGHIVHMPAHIYQRIGRYADASAANLQAILVDRRYLDLVDPPGYYPFYISHNYGFLAYSASMEGRKAESYTAAREAAKHATQDLVCGMPGMDFFWSEPLLVMVRFGMWDELLAEPKPDGKYQVLTALWHHAHGMALAATGQTEQATADLLALRQISASISDELLAGLNAGRDVLAVAAKVLEARIAEAEGSGDAIALWREAVALEDRLAYNEPADWFYPTRHYLGAALLDAGRAKEAVDVYEADLEDNPHNGWALFGLWKARIAASDEAGARRAKAEFDEAWARADIELTRTAY
jgi:tetratricopeptide (TPR) repeat protein